MPLAIVGPAPNLPSVTVKCPAQAAMSLHYLLRVRRMPQALLDVIMTLPFIVWLECHGRKDLPCVSTKDSHTLQEMSFMTNDGWTQLKMHELSFYHFIVEVRMMPFVMQAFEHLSGRKKRGLNIVGKAEFEGPDDDELELEVRELELAFYSNACNDFSIVTEK